MQRKALQDISQLTQRVAGGPNEGEDVPCLGEEVALEQCLREGQCCGVELKCARGPLWRGPRHRAPAAQCQQLRKALGQRGELSRVEACVTS